MDESKLHELLGKMVSEMGAAAIAPLVVLGDRLGLYRSLAQAPKTSDQLAEATDTHSRYVREWCAAQAAAGYISYDSENENFFMAPEQVAVFADNNSPTNMVGGYYAIASMNIDEPKITEAFRTGRGIGWGEHHTCLFCGTEKFFRPGYKASLVSQWIPALDGVADRLTKGGLVADIGCGHGASTLVMAEAFPKSTFVGYDFHPESIQCAKERAAEAGLDNVRFEVANAKEYPAGRFDLIAFFDCLHDMGDPVGAIKHAKESLAEDGSLMVVEPFAGDNLQDNLNPIGRMFYSFSTMICTPASISQEVGAALGAQAGPARLCEVIHQGGMSRVRRAAETPFNLILEAKL